MATRNCFAFEAPPANASSLRRAGFDLVNLANNHADDFGAGGEAQTTSALANAGVHSTGQPGEVTVLRRHGVRIALVGFAAYPWAQDMRNIPAAQALIRSATRRASVVIALIHAGAEGSDQIHTPVGTEYGYGEDRGDTRGFAHAAIDAGADLVLGSGPHVIRGIETYRGRLIAYSLGNFAGDHNFGLSGTLGMSAILKVRLTGCGAPRRGRWLPVRLVDGGQPEPDPGPIGADRVGERNPRST